MTNKEISRAALEGTITFEPDKGDGAYMSNAAHRFTAYVEVTAGQWQGEPLSLESTTATILAPDGVAGGKSITVPLTVDPDDNNKLVAPFYAIMPHKPEVDVKITAWVGDVERKSRDVIKDNIFEGKVQYELTAPLAFIPVVDRNAVDPANPSDPTRTLGYRVTLLEVLPTGGTGPIKKLGSPLAMDIVQFRDVGFFGKVAVYASNDSVTPEPVLYDTSVLQKKGFIRINIGEDLAAVPYGQQDVYICSWKEAVFANINIAVDRRKYNPSLPVMTYDIDGEVNYGVPPPRLRAPYGPTGKVLLNNINVSSIPVDLNVAPDTYSEGDLILMFLNNEVASSGNWQEAEGANSSLAVNKASILSTDDDISSKNELCYAAPQITGEVYMSPISVFQATGSPGPNGPDLDGKTLSLTAPYLRPASEFIDAQRVETGVVKFAMEAKQEKWTAAKDDIILTEVWLNGYNPISYSPRHGYVKDEKILDDKDVEGSTVTIEFLSTYFFRYEARKYPPPEKLGRCEVMYTVYKGGDKNTPLYSQVFRPYIDTVPPGQTGYRFHKLNHS